MKKAAAIQMVSNNNVSENLSKAKELISQAAADDASLIVLPENFAFMSDDEFEKLALKEKFGEGLIQEFLRKLSEKLNVFILAGSVPIASEDENKVYASALLFNNKGECISRYNKMHLFDVAIPNTTESHLESKTIYPGTEFIVSETPIGKLGLSICYDLRFPEMYRELVRKDAQILAVPSAFTQATGKAHWETLIRARAIENLCYVIAPNQGGKHNSRRETYGHSAIIDPWGNSLASLETGEGVIVAEIDLTFQANLRANFPVLSHR